MRMMKLARHQWVREVNGDCRCVFCGHVSTPEMWQAALELNPPHPSCISREVSEDVFYGRKVDSKAYSSVRVP